MLKRFIDWFTKSHEYITEHLYLGYYPDQISLIPGIDITFGDLRKGIVIRWLFFDMWVYKY
jgi:hypothetical protein